jgi:hypothetical protein
LSFARTPGKDLLTPVSLSLKGASTFTPTHLVPRPVSYA